MLTRKPRTYTSKLNILKKVWCHVKLRQSKKASEISQIPRCRLGLGLEALKEGTGGGQSLTLRIFQAGVDHLCDKPQLLEIIPMLYQSESMIGFWGAGWGLSLQAASCIKRALALSFQRPCWNDRLVRQPGGKQRVIPVEDDHRLLQTIGTLRARLSRARHFRSGGNVVENEST